MIDRSRQYLLWVALLVIAGLPRVLAAFLLPNEEGDPYAYAQAIDMMRASLVGGRFTIAELFGFWLPLYQFICALITSVVGHPLYVAKVFSAICGTGVCLLVFQLSSMLTASRRVALFAFALIALNPIHVMYSAFSMSDVPHALMVMSSLYFAIKNRWVLAAAFVAMGGLMRPESWMLILLLPALQFFLHRRVSVTAVLISLSAPLIWIYISWLATGNALEYFDVRSEYIRELLSRDPGLTSFSLRAVFANLQTLIYSTGHAVLVACLLATALLIWRVRAPSNRDDSELSRSLPAILAYFFSSLAFLLAAYFTRNQPAIFARYCLVLFALGLPILAWMFVQTADWKPVRALTLCGLLVGLCVWQWAVQLRDGAAFINLIQQKRVVADYLRGQLMVSSNRRVFCDDDTIRLMAGIPSDSFVRSSSSAGEARSFVDYLKENQVEFVVYEGGSFAQQAFGSLDEGAIDGYFQLVASTENDLRLYRTTF
jgi:hypothetical protein